MNRILFSKEMAVKTFAEKFSKRRPAPPRRARVDYWNGGTIG
jgi:hypothetical protein